ncbi:MAG TPA: class I SAM-dependent methyltransferase [Candidatus Acidoferrales bacterium]|nr:class I SAM-dependent methyltransferase [Candidatus Acidoferrales bacterium]
MGGQERIEGFRQQVRREWDDPQTVEAWRKWGRSNASLLGGVTRAIVEASGAAPGQTILDLASGSGQPALGLAAAVAPGGTVMATDQSAQMLAVVEESARLENLTNLRTQRADAESLPFSDAAFDSVTCRFGAMFFAEPVRAMRECLRVLRPGGRAVFAVWGSPQQPFFAMTAGVLRRYATIPEPEPGAPHIFRFAAPGSLAEVMREAGFQAVKEDSLRIACERMGTPESFWEEFREVAAPFRPLIAGLPAARRAELDAAVLAAMRAYSTGDRLKFSVDVNVATGTRA